MPITILKNNVPWGPFTRSQIQDGLQRGDFTLQYLAHGPGLKAWLPLGEVLDHFDRGASLPPLPDARYMPVVPASAQTPLPSIPIAEATIPAQKIAPTPPPMPAKSPEAIPSPAPKTDVQPKVENFSQPPAKPASFFPRFIAFALDCGILFLPVIFAFALAALAIQIQDSVEHADPESVHQGWLHWQQNFEDVLGLVALGGGWLYAACLECSRWQATVGKQWIGLKVTDVAGERLSFFHATGRHAAKFLSALPLFLGFTMALFSSTGLSLHDRLAKTRVVKK